MSSLEPDPHQFDESGETFSLHEPRALEQADFELWNDRFQLTVDHTGRARGAVLTPNAQAYAADKRIVYALDVATGDVWSLNWGPVFRDPAVFSFDIRRDSVSWLQEYREIASTLAVSVPRGAGLEAWRLQLSNQSGKAKRIRLFPVMPTGLLGLLSHESALAGEPFGILHDYFPYYVRIPDHEKMARRWNTTFLFASRPPDSWTALERDFVGFGDWGNPEALGRERLGGRHCHYESGVCACHYELILNPGEPFELGWIFGPARDADHAREIAAAYPPGEAYEKAVAEQRAFLREQSPPLKVATPDAAFNHYINHWAPERCIRIGRTCRFNPSPQARNAIQDAMALSLFDGEAARRQFRRIWPHQEADGFMPHGLPMQADAEIMPITLIPHKDTNVWGPLALDVYLRETGDYAFLDTEIPYADGSSGPLREHLERGLDWLLKDRSPRGLSHIGQGDWNDPLNMAGPEGRGESVWLTQALAYALEIWGRGCQKRGEDGKQWLDRAEECRQSVRRHAWDGDWFLRATADDGTLIGSRGNPEGSIFLNAQSWALMAGIPDEEQTRRLVASVEKHLGTPIAPAVLGPPFSGMVKHVGKLTLKSPGTGENGSIYSHAALFWAYALLGTGHVDAGWRVLRNLVPGGPGNPVSRCGQVPLYVPNFYRGPAAPEIMGRSSHSPNTGSAAWVYLTFLEKVIGLVGDGDSLCVDPHIPGGWNEVSGERVFRGTRYGFTIRRGQAFTVHLNGEPAQRRIPWQASPERQDLQVTVPVP